MTTIVCVGAVYLDTILTVPHYPKEDNKLRATELQVRCGGNCTNTLYVLEQLFKYHLQNHPHRKPGLYLSSVLPHPDCDATKTLRDSFSSTQLDPTCIYRPMSTRLPSSYIIQSKESGSRTIISHMDMDEMTLQDFNSHANQLEGDSRDKWFHFEGRSPEVTRCIKLLRDDVRYKSCKISVELEKPDRGFLVEAARHADVVFYSKIWAEHHGYDAPLPFLWSRWVTLPKAAVLCCTWGERGAAALQKSAQMPSEATVKAWKPMSNEDKVIDAVGAGDTFIAGMIFAMVEHSETWTLQRKLEFANELAGRKVYQEGFKNLISGYVRDGGALGPE